MRCRGYEDGAQEAVSQGVSEAEATNSGASGRPVHIAAAAPAAAPGVTAPPGVSRDLSRKGSRSHLPTEPAVAEEEEEPPKQPRPTKQPWPTKQPEPLDPSAIAALASEPRPTRDDQNRSSHPQATDSLWGRPVTRASVLNPAPEGAAPCEEAGPIALGHSNCPISWGIQQAGVRAFRRW